METLLSATSIVSFHFPSADFLFRKRFNVRLRFFWSNLEVGNNIVEVTFRGTVPILVEIGPNIRQLRIRLYDYKIGGDVRVRSDTYSIVVLDSY